MYSVSPSSSLTAAATNCGSTEKMMEDHSASMEQDSMVRLLLLHQNMPAATFIPAYGSEKRENKKPGILKSAMKQSSLKSNNQSFYTRRQHSRIDEYLTPTSEPSRVRDTLGAVDSYKSNVAAAAGSAKPNLYQPSSSFHRVRNIEKPSGCPRVKTLDDERNPQTRDAAGLDSNSSLWQYSRTPPSIPVLQKRCEQLVGEREFVSKQQPPHHVLSPPTTITILQPEYESFYHENFHCVSPLQNSYNPYFDHPYNSSAQMDPPQATLQVLSDKFFMDSTE